jgi:hypothetical protein
MIKCLLIILINIFSGSALVTNNDYVFDARNVKIGDQVAGFTVSYVVANPQEGYGN